MKNRLLLILIVAMTMLLAGSAFAQGKVYEGPDDAAGDVALRREAYMNGNRVLVEFKNTTELADWPDPEASKWPNAYYGYKMTDGIGLMVASRVYIEGDSTPVDNPSDVAGKAAAGLLDTLFYLQTNYREEQDADPNTGVQWNLQPAPGYVNELSETPALSNEPGSWPTQGWPFRNRELHWPGEWDGRFGRGVAYADLETYFVANDAQDQEYLPLNTQYIGPRYYPRPGRFIGEYRPTSVQNGQPWGGIGIRVEQRGFQWSNPQARDCIFWEYNIANISDYNLTEVAFGYWLDNAIGGEGNDRDIGAFNRREDLAYSWNSTGVGTGGRPTGTAGFAYLESPGKPNDGNDNDQDGMTDEKRDNEAVALVGPTDGYSNLEWFKSWYNLKDEDLREHWDADEDQDWDDGNDLNGNGVYDFGEDPGDDVGLDGVGPGELNYFGPDADGTECNHKPDIVAGRISEPDFGTTDISESDMLGLTMFDMFAVPEHTAPFPGWFRNDRSMWELMSRDSLNPFFGTPRNLAEVFATGVFPLDQGRTERVSMSQLYAYDPIAGLTSSHEAPALFKLKKTVQIIYERDYRFAQPPKTPTLKATAGDGQVILTWDNVADQFTREPLLNRVNDFEGYKLYRATDKKMTDPMVVTDGFGTPTFSVPIFECDKTDDITDFADYGLQNGQGYYLGSDKGIAHSYVDTDVQNGRTYYYVLVSYDYGIWPELLQGEVARAERSEGIAPSESAFVIDLDETEEVKRISQNVAIATPRPNAAGYTRSGHSDVDYSGAIGSGTIIPEIMAKDALLPGHKYEITFKTESAGPKVTNYTDHGGLYVTSGLQIWDVTDTARALVYSDVLEETPAGSGVFKPSLINTVLFDDVDLDVWRIAAGDTMTTGIFDGMRLKIYSPIATAEYDLTKQGWLRGSGPEPFVAVSTLEGTKFPWDYQIEFSDDPDFYTGRVSSVVNIKDESGATISRGDLLRELPFSFRCYTPNFVDSTTGEDELMDFLVQDMNKNGVFDILQDQILVGPVTTTGRWAGTIFSFNFRDIADASQLPKAGDVYQIGFKRPWFKNDVIKFSVTNTDGIDKGALDNEMDRIMVVPNPYVATNVMEPAISKSGLNQRRRLMFTHIPAKCTIKIFTVSGVLVDEIRVDNAPDNGIIHWDLKSKEGLDIAAGMYLYHVKADETGKEKLGKFAVIK